MDIYYVCSYCKNPANGYGDPSRFDRAEYANVARVELTFSCGQDNLTQLRYYNKRILYVEKGYSVTFSGLLTFDRIHRYRSIIILGVVLAVDTDFTIKYHLQQIAANYDFFKIILTDLLQKIRD